ncbi:DUF3011 domain-containing protein [Pseudobdellovibrio exovorus]|uniref:Bdellovibrio beta-sandwich domain-containing protein n=1 Tax=Pseudobdellovibrio exovorus JSS TaxID=1184267 RepID=M4VBQ0_9BACT|nr:DUF3011 domain-containing protein [Pseudobdellovibrio exovorus]AGH95451.1 hypothetical protein A11Q_1235 [Pseudobdellovibrio exovorus JSS]
MKKGLIAIAFLVTTVAAQLAQAYYVEARLNQRVRGSASISLNRALGLDRYQGYEIDSIQISGRADGRFVDLNIFYGREELGRAYLQSPRGETVNVYPRYGTIIRRGVDLRLDARGEGIIESVVVRFRQGSGPQPPYPPPYPPPSHPDTFVQVECYSIIKPLITECKLDNPILSVRLVRQHSSAACVYGSTWFYDSRKISVTKGCRATFEARVRR